MATDPIDPRTRLDEGRQVPEPLKRLLAWDVQITKRSVSFLLNFVPLRSLKTHCRFLEVSCHGIAWFVGWFVFCWLFDKPSLYEIEVNILFGLIIDVVCVSCLKAATRRRRPVATDDPFCIGPDKFSFPSGHASRAFFVASFFTVLAPLHFIFWGPLFAWATCTALSRLLLYRHHVLDITCGCVLGILEATLLGLLWINKDTANGIMSWISDDRYLVEGQTGL